MKTGLFSIPGMVSMLFAVTLTAARAAAPEQSGEAAQMTDIHDIKPPVAPGFDPSILYFILGGVLVLALAAAGWVFWKRRKAKSAQDATVWLFPDEAAYRSLDQLRGEENLSGKEFYFRLSAITRGYIQERFGIDALEMTTEEFVPRIEDLGVETTLQTTLRDLCHFADPIKFAAAPVERHKMFEDLSFVRNFVKQTTPEKETGEENG